MVISYSKVDKQTRYKYNIFDDYESVEDQKVLHLLRIIIDKNYYYNKKSTEECIYLINSILCKLDYDEDKLEEMQRKVFYHLSKHIILSQDETYNIKDVWLKEWKK